jgi:hypothetical protein
MADTTTWNGDELRYSGRVIGGIVQDKTYPSMWRVRLPDGSLSDMVNRPRAKDAAEVIALAAAKAKA